MRNKLRLLATPAALVVAILATVSTATADSVQIMGAGASSTEGLGSYTGVLDYEADPLGTIGLLTIELTNTSDTANGGYITGFLFNIGSSDVNASAALLNNPPATHPFDACSGNGLSGQPYGNPFDAGAALGGKFLGGGNPTAGIAVGDTGRFSFEIEAADAGQLTAVSFLESGPFDFNFIVRFRGFEDGGSDKVPAAVVPLPTPLAMGAAGLAGMGLAGWRKRRLAKSEN